MGRREFFLHFWLILGVFSFSISFHFIFVLGEGDVFFFHLFSQVFLVFFDHFWPAPLLAQTASWPLCLIKPFCAQTFANLTPENLGQWGCPSGQFAAHVLFSGPWTSLRGTPLAQDHPVCCVVLCCGVSVRCVFKFFVVRPRFGRFPSAGPPPPDRPKFRFFSLSRHYFHSFFLLGVFSWNFGGVIEGRDPQLCTFGLTGCRVKPRQLLQNVKNNFTIDLLSPPLPLDFRKSQWSIVTNFACIQKKKTRLEHNRTKFHGMTPPRPLSGPTPLGPHCFWVVVCAVCAAPDSAACCCFSCCLCSCCGLLLPLFFAACAWCCFWAANRRTLPSHLCNVWPSKMLTTFFKTDWSPYTSTNWDKICIPPNFHGKTLLLPPPLPPHHPSGPHTSWP